MKYTNYDFVVRNGSTLRIPDRMVNFALEHGRVEGDRRVLDRKEIRLLLEGLEQERALLMKLRDKGVIAVATSADTVITAFNIEKGRNHG